MTRLAEGWETRSQSLYFAPRALKQITDAFNDPQLTSICVVVDGWRTLDELLAMLAAALEQGDVGLCVPTQYMADCILQLTADRVGECWGCKFLRRNKKRVEFNHTDDPEKVTDVVAIHQDEKTSRGYSQVDIFLACFQLSDVEITKTEWLYTLAVYGKQGTRLLAVSEARVFNEQQFLSTRDDASTKIIRL